VVCPNDRIHWSSGQRESDQSPQFVERNLQEFFGIRGLSANQMVDALLSGHPGNTIPARESVSFGDIVLDPHRDHSP